MADQQQPAGDTPTASQSSPYFLQGGAPQGSQGLSITSQRSALNEQVNGVANDLTSQTTALTTALAAIVTALSNKPTQA